ncbi:MAG TPA: phosphatidate cytidylyltransferase [Burkholderiales bacterium]|nr:phosphatidate cytidylyltransferase [Burkholderiales bacterium]
MLRTRVITAFFLAIVFLGALFWLPQSGWMLFTFAVALVAFWEWSRLAQFSGTKANFFLVLTFLVGLALLYAFSSDSAATAAKIIHFAFLAASLFWVFVAPLWLRYGWRPKNVLVLAATGWLVIFPTWFAMMELRGQGPWTLLGLMALVWIADTAAYFAGRTFGKHKLAPSISPGKTWEGVAGAVIGVLIYVTVLLWLAAERSEGRLDSIVASWPVVMVGCLILVALSITGDLFESWMKRGAGLKDSSNLLPGHGGVLDRLDALTSTLPVAPIIFIVAMRLTNP